MIRHLAVEISELVATEILFPVQHHNIYQGGQIHTIICGLDTGICFVPALFNSHQYIAGKVAQRYLVQEGDATIIHTAS